jgi:alpha-ketoglutarate-dependent taurine dioxygenase
MELSSIDGTFAREIRNLDLWRNRDDATAAELREAFREHPLLVLRRQILTEDELMWLGAAVGTPKPYAEAHWQSEYREVVILSNLLNANGKKIGGTGNSELPWHTDQSYYPHPVTGCFLYATVIPTQGGETSWANLYDAYDALPRELQAIADDAVGTFSYLARSRAGGRKRDNHDEKRIAETPDTKHRLVHKHPVTGRRSLFIDPRTVTAIDGMPDDEAHAFLDELEHYATRQENVYHHQWQVGDLVLWDNAVLLHRRNEFPNDQNRLLKRMIIELPGEEHPTPGPVN